MTQLYIGADHGGYALKEALKPWLEHKGYQVDDCGAQTLDENDDYPAYALAVAEKVARDPSHQALGIILCRTSAGVVMAANKVKGIRAASVVTPELAELARSHNNINVLGLGADGLDLEQATQISMAFLTTSFSSDERHVRRLRAIEEYESTTLV